MVTMLGLSFTSCSSDDDISTDNLEGVWGLVHSEGYDNEDEHYEWNDDYNPISPSSYDDLKIEIINTTGNTYLLTQYYWSTYSKTWKLDDKYIARLEGKKLITEDQEVAEVTIVSLTSSQLIVEAKTNYRYIKQTFRKLSSIGDKD